VATVVAGQVQGPAIGVLVVLLLLELVVVQVVQVVRIVVVVRRVGLQRHQLAFGLLVGQGQGGTQGRSTAIARGADTRVIIIAIGSCKIERSLWVRKVK